MRASDEDAGQSNLDGRRGEAVSASDPSVDFRAIFERSPTPFVVVAPPDWTIVAANDARLEVTATSRSAQIGRPLFEIFPDDPEDPDADGVRNLRASLERVIATRLSDTMPVQRYPVRDATGQFVDRWWTPVNVPVIDAAGEVVLIIHRVEDVTEIVRLKGKADAQDQLVRDQQAVIDRLRATEAALRQREQHLQLMVNELNHRVKNTLTVVQSLVAQTLRRLDGEDAAEAVTARLLALSRAHDVLTDERWSGADLQEIAKLAAEPYLGGQPPRYEISGPPVTVSTRLAIALALAFHELATNAVKYGALSTPDGRVRLSWRTPVDDGRLMLELEWREIGGPPVARPVVRGFGSRLIERSLTGEARGAAELIFNPEGLVCRLSAELDSAVGGPPS